MNKDDYLIPNIDELEKVSKLNYLISNTHKFDDDLKTLVAKIEKNFNEMDTLLADLNGNYHEKRYYHVIYKENPLYRSISTYLLESQLNELRKDDKFIIEKVSVFELNLITLQTQNRVLPFILDGFR